MVVVEVDQASSALGGRPWRLLHQRPVEGAEGWAAVHGSDAQPPLWLQEEA